MTKKLNILTIFGALLITGSLSSNTKVQAQTYSSTRPVTASVQPIATPTPTPVTVLAATPVPTPVATPVPTATPAPVVVATPSPSPAALPVTAGGTGLTGIILALGIATCIFTVYRLQYANERK